MWPGLPQVFTHNRSETLPSRGIVAAIYLNAVDRMLARAVEITRRDKSTGFQYARPNYAPNLKKQIAPYEKHREIFRKHVSWPVETVTAKINPVMRGWVNYFRVGHPSICFGVVKRWLEERVRRI